MSPERTHQKSSLSDSIRNEGDACQASICEQAWRGVLAESFQMRGFVTTLKNSYTHGQGIAHGRVPDASSASSSKASKCSFTSRRCA